jgi:hypothetical protein
VHGRHHSRGLTLFVTSLTSGGEIQRSPQGPLGSKGAVCTETVCEETIHDDRVQVQIKCRRGEKKSSRALPVDICCFWCESLRGSLLKSRALDKKRVLSCGLDSNWALRWMFSSKPGPARARNPRRQDKNMRTERKVWQLVVLRG